MRINILQHTPDEGPGAIKLWADKNQDDLYVYHPATFNYLPTAEETDFLVILGGPMSPNDDLPWIKKERSLIRQLLDQHKPLFGACFGGQQIAKTLGGKVIDAPVKEVGWAPVCRKSTVIPGLPAQMTALHWHEQEFTIPSKAQLLFSSKLVRNQGFLYGKNVLALQFHFEPLLDNVREMAVNDRTYPLKNNALQQTAAQIIAHGVPQENRTIMFKLLNFITRR